MKTKHTPGPWITAGSGILHKDSTYAIAEVNDENPEYDDNVQLIAAAPEMLEALNNLVNAACGDTI